MTAIAVSIAIVTLFTVIVDAIGVYPAPSSPNYRSLEAF